MVAYRAPQQPAVQVGSVIMVLRGSSVTASGRPAAGPVQNRQLRALPSGWTSARTSAPSTRGRTSAQGSAVQSSGILWRRVRVLTVGCSLIAP
ncbi:hypothetical protein [Nocardiopsis sp. NPDC055824]